jgi:hypothetical protein
MTAVAPRRRRVWSGRTGVPDHTRWDAGHDGVWRDAPGDDGSGTDDGPRPDRDTGEDGRIAADRGALADRGVNLSPVLLRLQSAVAPRGSRVEVVGEHHAVADEDLVLDGDPGANERVRGDLASPADPRILLNFDECADLRGLADVAPVQIDQIRVSNLDPVAHLHIRCDHASCLDRSVPVQAGFDWSRPTSAAVLVPDVHAPNLK